MDESITDINNEPISDDVSETTPSLSFYRTLEGDLALLSGQQIRNVCGVDKLWMSLAQLSYCCSFCKEIFHRPITAGELMFIDGFCKLLKCSLDSVAPEELLLNEDYIAQTYADIMGKRARLFPEYSEHLSFSDIFSFANILISKENSKGLPFSESRLFSAKNDLEAKLKCLTGGFIPEFEGERVCMGQRVSIEKSVSSKDHCAIIYLSSDRQKEALTEFISSYRGNAGISQITVCRGSEIFSLLVKTYSFFSINTATLPSPKEGIYAEQPSSISEMMFLDAANAFLSDELFGETALVIFGKRTAIRSLCRKAVNAKLPYFNGIQSERNHAKNRKLPKNTSTMKIDSSLFRTLSEISNNICVKIPTHDLSGVNANGLLPTVEHVYSKVCGKNREDLYTVKLDLSDSALPFHAALLAATMLVITAASNGTNLRNGEYAFSFGADLSFDTQISSGKALAAILALYRVQTELCIKDENSYLSYSDNGSFELTLSLRTLTNAPASVSFGDGSIAEFLSKILSEELIPNFEILRKLISGDSI